MDSTQASAYYPYWETVSAYRVRRDVLERWLRNIFYDEQIQVQETDDSKYGFWLVRPLSKDEKKTIKQTLTKVASL